MPVRSAALRLTNQYRLLWLVLRVEGGSWELFFEKDVVINPPGRGYHSMLHLQLWGPFRVALHSGNINALRTNSATIVKDEMRSARGHTFAEPDCSQNEFESATVTHWH